jgi:hypothetical protein
MNIDNNITLDDLKDALLKYSFEGNNKFYYYSRKNNIWNLVYDHFFKNIYNLIEDYDISSEGDGLKNFIQAIEYCNTDYLYEIKDVKPNLNFSERSFKITNLYNVTLYEIYVTKILKFVLHLIYKHDLNSYLVNWKLFSYFSSFNYKINDELEIIDLEYEHYDSNWLLYEEFKKELLKKYDFYIETDIKWFYDNINHEVLIWKLKYFFNKYWTENLDNFLYIFWNILYKVNGYNKSWLPQWVMASDILANLFLWLIFFIDKDYILFEQNNWIWKIFWLEYISYNDDFIFFSNNDDLENIFNSKIKHLYQDNKLPLSLEKTSLVSISKYYKNYDEVNFDNIINKEKSELTILKRTFINYLKKNIEEIDIKWLKRNFKWIHNLRNAKTQVKKSFASIVFKILFEDIKWKNKNEKVKKIYLLLVISPSNFVYLIKSIEDHFQEKYWKSFEWLFLNEVLRKYCYYITDPILVKFYMDLNAEYYDLEYNNTKKYITELIKKNNNKIIRSFLNSKNQPLDLVLKDNWLVWLYELIYKHNDINNFKENIIWIKFLSLFWIHINYENINSYLEKNKTELISKLKLKLNNIMDDMLIIKNISPNFYLKHPSFIADLYSILNILLTIFFNIIDKKNIEVKINGWDEEWYIEIKYINKNNEEKKNPKEPIRKYIKSFDLNHIHLLYYIAKKRAIYNHKENDIDKDIDYFIYKKNNDLNTFNWWINNLITYILWLIDKELLWKLD